MCFACFDQHVKYRMSRGFLLPSSLLLDCHNKQVCYQYIMNLISDISVCSTMQTRKGRQHGMEQKHACNPLSHIFPLRSVVFQ